MNQKAETSKLSLKQKKRLEFGNLLQRLYMSAGHVNQLTAEFVDVYWEELQGYSVDEIARACQWFSRNREDSFFPPTAEFHKTIRATRPLDNPERPEPRKPLSDDDRRWNSIAAKFGIAIITHKEPPCTDSEFSERRRAFAKKLGYSDEWITKMETSK